MEAVALDLVAPSTIYNYWPWVATRTNTITSAICSTTIVGFREAIGLNELVRRFETFARNDKDFSSSSEVTRRWTFLIWKKNKNSIFLTLRYIKSTIICYRCSTSIWLLVFLLLQCFFLVYTIVKMYPFKNNAKTKSTEKNSKTIPLIN